MAEGKPSRCEFSKKFGKSKIDFSIQLKQVGQGEGEGGHMLPKRVSEIKCLTFNQGEPRAKGTPVKKSGGKPFINNLSRMKRNGLDIGPTMTDLAVIGRIL